MKLRKETINAIISEVEPIRLELAKCIFKKDIKDVYDHFLDAFMFDSQPLQIATDRAIDYSLQEGYFDIITSHTETTILMNGDKLELGYIEVWEDEQLCGTWSYDQIKNNEVEFNM